MIWMDKNENAFDIPMELKKKAMEKILSVEWNRYPFPYPDRFTERSRELLATEFKVEPTNIMMGNGSGELLPAFLSLRKRAVFYDPTFETYDSYCRSRGTIPEVRDLDSHFNIPSNTKIEGGSIYLICSPNNPTGNLQPRDVVEDIVEKADLCIIDEAYWEFSRQNLGDLVRDHENVIISRTFSKAYGLAGLRCGYMVASEKIIKEAVSKNPPIMISNVSSAITETLLENSSYVEKTVSYIIKERDAMYHRLKDVAFPSQTNFLLLNLDCLDFMTGKGIALRKLFGKLSKMARATISKSDENQTFIDAVEEYVSV